MDENPKNLGDLVMKVIWFFLAGWLGWFTVQVPPSEVGQAVRNYNAGFGAAMPPQGDRGK